MGMRLNPDLERRVLELAAADAPRPAISEKAFMAEVVRLAKRNGWLVFHPFDMRKSEAGWPDLAFLRDRFFVAELKVADGRLTAAQATWIDAFRAIGIQAYEWRPDDWEEIGETLAGNA